VDLTSEEAPELYICFLRDTLELVETVPGIDIFVSYEPVTAEAQIRGLFGDRHPMIAQRGDDLGRIYYALEDMLSAGYESACVIG
jgi:hypothetical protein